MGGFDGSFEGRQRLEALDQANSVRLARAALKKRIRAGAVSAANVILECPCEVAKMPVSDILMSQKRWGETRCRRVLMAAGIPEDKQVGTLTERQRVALVADLAARPKPPSPTPSPARQLSAV